MRCANRQVYGRNVSVEALETRELFSDTISAFAFFDGTNGARPLGGPVCDAAGNVYGTTFSGGSQDKGTVYKIAAGTNVITTLASFNGTNGAGPMAGLITDSAGNLYGTTWTGGAKGMGTVFEVKAGTSTITTLGSFNGTNGFGPQSRLAMDSNGNLYGTTVHGGAGYSFMGGKPGDGAVFEVHAGSHEITLLASFDRSSTGRSPMSGVTLDSHGNIFGVIPSDAGSQNGSVYEVAAGSGAVTVLATFPPYNRQPNGDLVIDDDGNLYGTTSHDGDGGHGSVFKLRAGANTIDTLASFDGIAAEDSSAGLTMDAHGNLFGTSDRGGALLQGMIFEIPAGTSTISVLASLDDINSDIVSGVAFDRAGNLYCTSYIGGAKIDGSVFKLSGVIPAVDTAPSQVALAASSQTVNAGQSITFTATVTATSSGATPTGTVSFLQDGNVVGSTGVQGDGTAQFTTSALPAGSHQITAQYSGDVTYDASTSAVLSVQIGGGGAGGGGGGGGGVGDGSGSSQTHAAFGRVSLPASVVAGGKLSAKIPVIVTNAGAASAGVYSVEFFANTAPTLDGQETSLGSQSHKLKLKTGAGKPFNFSVKSLPPSLGDGTYYILAKVTDPQGGQTTAATAETVTVAAPFVQPMVTAGAVTPAVIAVNKSGSITVTIQNQGNVDAHALSVALTTPNSAELASKTSRVKIAPGKSLKIRLRFKLTPALKSTLGTGPVISTINVVLDGVAASATAGGFVVA